MLRGTHDRHRGLRPRFQAQIQAASRGTHLGGYLMMPILPSLNRNAGRDCCWAWPGPDGARFKAPAAAQNRLQTPSCNSQIAFTPLYSDQRTLRRRQSIISRRTVGCWQSPPRSSNPHSPRIGGCHPCALHPAISCPGAFRTPAVGACGWPSHTGIRKPAHNPLYHCGSI